MEIKKRNQVKLDKKDYLRALLTDTSPSDVPIIFSNDGFATSLLQDKINIKIENTKYFMV